MKKFLEFDFKKMLLLFALIPLISAITILTVFNIIKLDEELESNVYSRLKACAVSTREYFEYDIVHEILEPLDEDSLSFIDSLESQEIELTLFEKDTRVTTSIKDSSNDTGRNIGTKANSDIWSIVQTGKDYQADKITINNEQYYVYYTPVYIGNEVWGMAFAGEKEAVVENAKENILILSLLMAAGLIILFIIIALIMAKKVVRPLSEVSNAIELTSAGNLNADTNIHSTVHETKVLIESTKKLQEILQDTIGKTQNISSCLKEDAQNVFELSEQSKDGSEQISSAIEDLAQGATAMAQNVQSINEQIIKMSASVDDINNDVEKMKLAAKESEEANTVATDYMKKLHDASNKSVNAVEKISALIEACADSATKIENAVDMISGIASQTNLLALNASIEAARAGEAGKGFAVVATEIKSLSEQSNSSADEIRTIINEIVENVNECVEGSKDLNNIINNQMRYLNDTTEKIEDMSNTSKQMAAGSNEIGINTTILMDVKNTVLENISDLSAISEENAASSEQVSASVIQISNAIKDIADNSNKTNDRATSLTETVSYFN